jgi:hypothetical protein
VKTRTLILLSLACGLAILLAGGVFLFNTAANRDRLTLRDGRATGEVVEVGSYRAGVLAVDRRADAVVLTVVVRATTTPLGDAAAPWSLKIRDLRPLVDAGDLPAPACRGVSVEPGGSLECALAFAPEDGEGRAEFAVTGARDAWFIPD